MRSMPEDVAPQLRGGMLFGVRCFPGILPGYDVAALQAAEDVPHTTSLVDGTALNGAKLTPTAPMEY